VPYDFFDYREEIIDDNQYWEGSKKILKAAKIVKRHPQMFGVYVSNFSCAPDSMTITTFRTLMGTKPSLTLELDGHTADAGINTRIDAAVDIIKNFKKLQDQVRDPDYSDFTPAKVVMENDAGFFISSEGEKIPLKDERVVMLIPSMGDISARLFAAAMRGLGINAENLPEGNTTILKYGRANSTGKECLPLILIAGSLMDYIENRWDGKKYIVLFVAQGAGDCRLGQYPVFLRDMILKNRLKNVVPLPLSNEDGFAGLGPMISVRGIQALLTSDVLDDIRSAIMANSVDPDKGLEIFESEIKRLCHIMESTPKTLFKELKQTSRTFKTKIPVKTPIEESKYIALVGEIYVRRDHFSHKWLNRQFAKKGFVVKDAYISEWIFYVDYLLKKNMLEPMKSLHMKYERLVRKFYMLYAERRVKRILARSDYYQYSKIDIDTLINHSKHIIPVAYKGEPGLTLGVGLHETIEKYCGVINLGPFGCMPTRFSEAVTTPLMKIENKIEAMQMNDPSYTLPEIFNGNMNIPFLTIETDGNVYPQLIEARLEMFTLQAERMYQLMKQAGFVG
jgi:predicted nucleotide-binding protein (sugar kinase/HSP70/actin superfamily)